MSANMNPLRWSDTLIRNNSARFSPEEMISAITLDPWLDEEELDSEQKPPTRSKPNTFILGKPQLDRPGSAKRFDKGSESAPCVMPRRRLSGDSDDLEDDDLDYKASQHSNHSGFFLKEDSLHCSQGEKKDDSDRTDSVDSCSEISEEVELNVTKISSKIDDKSVPWRRSNRTRQSADRCGSDSSFEWNRSAVLSQSLDLCDVLEDQDYP